MFNVATRALSMGGILLDAKTERRRPLDPPHPHPHSLAFKGSHYQPHNDTIHCVHASAIPFGFHQRSAAVEGYLRGRVAQEFMSEGLKC